MSFHRSVYDGTKIGSPARPTHLNLSTWDYPGQEREYVLVAKGARPEDIPSAGDFVMRFSRDDLVELREVIDEALATDVGFAR